MRRPFLLLAMMLSACEKIERYDPPSEATATRGSALLGSPESRNAEPRVALDTVRLRRIPFVQQKPDFCGEACLSMWLKSRGLDVDQDEVFGLTGLDPALGRGAWARDLRVAVERLGLDASEAWTEVPARDSAAMDAAFAALHADLRLGIPSIICTRFDGSPGAPEHFRLITGYDAHTDEVIFHDPAGASGADQRLQRRTLLALWPLKYGAETWTLVRFRLDGEGLALPSELIAKDGEPPDAADLAQTVMLMEEMGGEPFTILVEPPYVVAGDEHPRQVAARTRTTIAWAHAELRKHFFARDPERPVAVWLFRDDESYTRHVFAFLGQHPTTPYGFADHHGLYMNIGTGGGTLVHEMVHPLMRANFPACPPWYNEGLASLYEHVGKRYGRIWGHTNWRLDGLQQSLASDEVPPFAELMALDSAGFYDAGNSGRNYAQSRFLLQYLQDHGQLEDFHRAILADETDPSGVRALRKTVGDLGAFQQTWSAWVAGLSR